MTNTHINVGGHKITTNKVGQVHTITTFADARISGSFNYCVVNNVCFVDIVLKSSAVANNISAYTSMPKAKISGIGWTPNDSAVYVTTAYPQTLLVNATTANATMSVTFSYPVADDWVES